MKDKIPASTAALHIRARAPLRLGLAGGGTDVAPYCDEFGGAVLNATIDRYAYAFIAPSEDGRTHFAARDLGIEESFSPVPDMLRATRLALHGGVYRRMMAEFNGGVLRPLRRLPCRSACRQPAGNAPDRAARRA